MTKYEWESELKKNIHRLPDKEIVRVMDYYGELFDDKIESGLREKDIISEFGNPLDVADKIMSGFDGELRADRDTRPITAVPTSAYMAGNNPTQTSRDIEKGSGRGATSEEPSQKEFGRNTILEEPSQPQASSKSVRADKVVKARGTRIGRIASLVLIAIFLGWIPLTIGVVIWSLVLALGLAGIACGVAGVAAIVPSAIMFSTSVPVAVVQLSICAACIGIGILLVIIAAKLSKVGYRITKKMISAIGKWVSRRKVSYED